ncbi:sensor histidine kinase [Paenibacillus caui]|uniref:sensor histidine kinase n=1 Tax=Paenibacillus caui TaxID=2873927 RepID=UPI001CA93A02|nr:sensor histidine kinase [Paenibacillus caui]
MKYLLLKIVIVILVLTVVGTAIMPVIDLKNKYETDKIKEWQLVWVDKLDPSVTEAQLGQLEGWKTASTANPLPGVPKGEHGSAAAWIRLVLPAKSGSSVIMMQNLFGKQVLVLFDNRVVYQTNHKTVPYSNNILLPISPGKAQRVMYIGVSSSRDQIGLKGEVSYGNFNALLIEFVKKDLSDFILGSAFIFIAVIMLMCSLFLNDENMKGWLSLSIVILCIGILVITYSPFMYNFYGEYEALYDNLFDLSMFVFFPVFTYYVEQIFDKSGFLFLFRRFRQFQMVYSGLCAILLLANRLGIQMNIQSYRFITVRLLGYLIIFQLAFLFACAIINAVMGKKEGIIFTIGFSIFTFTALVELIWYFAKEQDYRFFLWKWGVLCFVLSLIIILGRRFAKNHEQVVEYSKRLEMFNNELQRSEKMDIISELAASVAHEVRNPLQVTRGFIQLLNEKSENNQEKVYLAMALEELDRASDIITDFLTFAKPEVGKVSKLNILQEFKHIESILIPMANLLGGKIDVDIPEHLHMTGSSSKFKQAFINIIKNSIESLQGEGEIRVWAYEENENVYIHVKDNGEGMTEAELARLGEPYFSNKTKGTGLGLMVTFRIIEVMQGEIEFTSVKGKGTEAVIRFPSSID